MRGIHPVCSRIACLMLSCLTLAACDERVRGDSAATGAMPPMFTAVGPVPGPPTKVPSPSNPYSEDEAAFVEGRQLFVRFNCSGCHGGRAGGGMGPSLRDIDWIYGNADGQIFDSIDRGRANGMPAWGRRLSQDQIWRLVSYLKTLRTSNEPDPPVTS